LRDAVTDRHRAIDAFADGHSYRDTNRHGATNAFTDSDSHSTANAFAHRDGFALGHVWPGDHYVRERGTHHHQ
jgi:hypothetical protein